MKKAKVILLSLCIFAVLGAVLAFKAKTGGFAFFYNNELAFDPSISSINVCPELLLHARSDGFTLSYATRYYQNIPGGILHPVTMEIDCRKLVECVPLFITVD